MGTITVGTVVVAAPFAGSFALADLELAGAAWSGAFGLFAILYLGSFVRPRSAHAAA